KIWQDATIQNIGIYAEANYKLSNKWMLISGIRTDFVEAKIEDPAADFEALYGSINTENDTNLSFNTSLKYRNNGFKSQLSFGRGVRSASMIERFINHFSVGVDPYEYVGNPNLKPEKNTQLELSTSKHFTKITVGANVFYSFLDDYIVPVVNPNIPRKFMPTVQPTIAKQFTNIDKAYQTGVEFLFNYKASNKWLFNSAFSYTQGKNRALNEPLPQIPPFKAILEVKYQKEKYWVAVQSNLVAAQNKVAKSFNEKQSKGYGVVDLRLGFEPNSNISIGASIQNVFDKQYYNHLNFSYKNADVLMGKIYEPGRSFTTYVKYTF
ncbi:MAG TPA: TonB-dependent receptor, partial [Flavobacteriaceae bacterium]|nr:TonB-dependent receptor [Flavobacteriaceae bacterium]